MAIDQDFTTDTKQQLRLGETRIDLNTVPRSAFDRELRQESLRGRLSDFTVPTLCNFIECRFGNVETEKVAFSRCDFKDNAFLDCRFSNTQFNGLGFVLNTLTNVHFERCGFFDSVIQNCDFYDSTFEDCDFTSLVIKDCSFTRCRFIRCRTSNKLFEMCLITECRFEETQLQIQSILENFGIRSDQVLSPLRTDRLDHNAYTMQSEDLERWLSEETEPLGRLCLHYFIACSLLEGSTYLDAALNIQYWISTQSTIGSFSVVLTRFCQFLLDLHDRDELAYLPLVRLHAITGEIAPRVPTDPRMRQAQIVVYGIHLSIARQIESFAMLVRQFSEGRKKNLVFLVEGKHPKSFFRIELPEFFSIREPRIVSLVPHNSPWEMTLGFSTVSAAAAFVGLFFSTRTRIELSKVIFEEHAPISGKRTKRPKHKVSITKVVVGAASANTTRSLLHLMTYVTPTLAADFQLSVSTQCIAKARKFLLACLK